MSNSSTKKPVTNKTKVNPWQKLSNINVRFFCMLFIFIGVGMVWYGMELT